MCIKWGFFFSFIFRFLSGRNYNFYYSYGKCVSNIVFFCFFWGIFEIFVLERLGNIIFFIFVFC